MAEKELFLLHTWPFYLDKVKGLRLSHGVWEPWTILWGMQAKEDNAEQGIEFFETISFHLFLDAY